MGIEVSSAKGGPTAEMNVVPLIDVLLVLLIIFMVITPLTPQGLDARVPQPPEGHAPPVPPEHVVVVQVGADGSVSINQQACPWEALAGRLQEIFKARAERVAFVQGEAAVEFAVVARAIDVMRAAGVEQVGLLGPGPAGR